MRLRLRPQSAVRDSGNSHGRERRPCTACLRWQRVWRKGKGRGVALIILTPSAHAAQQAVHETGGVHRCGVQRSRRTARTLGRGGRDLPASALHLPDQSKDYRTLPPYCRFQQHCRGRFRDRRRKCFLQQLCSAVAAPERPRRASSAPQRPPGACAVSRPTLPTLWCGQPLPPAANSAPCPGSACAFAARAAGGVHSGDSVRAPCSVLAAIAVVLASMRCQLPVRPAGAGLGDQTAPPASVISRRLLT